MGYQDVLTLIDENSLNFGALRESGFRAYQPFLQKCIALEGSGNIDEDGTHFVCVVADENKANKELAVILSTLESANEITIEIQNMQAQLASREAFAEVRRVITDVDTIRSLLVDGEDFRSENDVVSDSDVKANKETKTLTVLKSHVASGIEMGASDMDIVVQGNDKAWVKLNVDSSWSEVKPVAPILARDMVSSALQTQSKDFSGQMDVGRVVECTVDLDVDVAGVVERVALRVRQTFNHDGFIMTARIIRTDQTVTKTIDSLGFDADLEKELVNIMNNPYGVFLVTAPTNQGKSTTLASLYMQVEVIRKIVLIEDPVEYLIPHPCCYQRSPKKDKAGSDLKSLLKGTLRESADIVGVSEVRDEEVASLIMTQALTGTLMVSTLHSTDAVAALERMVDLKIHPKTLTEDNGVKGVFSQRLVPKLCEHCKVPVRDEKYGDIFTRRVGGCSHCRKSGCSGRVPVGEFLKVTTEVRRYVRLEDWGGLRDRLQELEWRSMSERVEPFIRAGIVCPKVAHMTVGNVLGE